MPDFRPTESLTEKVAVHLENQIAFGQLKSGQRIFEGATAKDLNVSNGCVREALLLLEKRHLVRNVARKGAYVTDLDEPFVRGLYEALLVYLTHTGLKLLHQWQPSDLERLESLYKEMQGCFSQGKLMRFLDLGIEYTQASLVYADNFFITAAINDLWPSAKRCAFVALKQGNRFLEDSLNQMRDSIEAIKSRDQAKLIEIMHYYAEQQANQVVSCLPREPHAPEGG